VRCSIVGGEYLLNPAKPRPFFGALESLRGIAALIVAINHIRWMNPTYHWNFVRHGYLMVDFFFVLSGFVIYHSYGQKISSGRDLSRFIWLRFGRLYPLHLAMLLAFLGLEGSSWLKEFITGNAGQVPAFTLNSGWAFLTNILLVQAVGIYDHLTFNSVSWSIGTEFYTYLLFAFILLFARKKSALVGISVLLIFSSIFVVLSAGKTDLSFNYDYGMFRCIPSFFLGVMTYKIYELFSPLQDKDIDKRKERTFPAFLYPFAVIASIGLVLGVKDIQYSDFLFPPLAALLILSLTTIPNGLINRVLNLKPFLWLGKTSYSIYMVQLFVFFFCESILKDVFKVSIVEPQKEKYFYPNEYQGIGIFTNSIFVCLAIITILILAHFTYQWIEAPCRKKSKELAEKWFPKGVVPSRQV
jgi:peptidoglycan/LPS O-acetylase OafA/YrhL